MFTTEKGEKLKISNNKNEETFFYQCVVKGIKNKEIIPNLETKVNFEKITKRITKNK